MMDFSDALKAMKSRLKLTRDRWENPDVYVVARSGYPGGIVANEGTAHAIGLETGSLFRLQPYLMARVADGSFVPWPPTQLDLFATDWEYA